jgi:hypothetical protein
MMVSSLHHKEISKLQNINFRVDASTVRGEWPFAPAIVIRSAEFQQLSKNILHG